MKRHEINARQGRFCNVNQVSKLSKVPVNKKNFRGATNLKFEQDGFLAPVPEIISKSQGTIKGDEKVGTRSEEIVAVMVDEEDEEWDNMEDDQQRGSPALLNNRQLTWRMTQTQDLADLVSLFAKERHSFNTINISAISNRIVRLADLRNPQHVQAVQHAMKFVEAHVLYSKDVMGPQELCGLVWAWRRLQHPLSEALLQKVAQLACADGAALLHKAHPQGLCNVAWGLARADLDMQLPAMAILWDAIIDVMLVKIERKQCTPAHLAIMAHELTVVKIYDATLFREICREALELVPDFRCQDIAKLMWALAASHHNDVELLLQLSRAAAGSSHGFTPQGLANVLWAIGRCKLMGARPACELLADKVLKRIDEFSSKELSMAVWGVAKLESPARRLLMATANRLCTEPRSFDAYHASNVIWSLAQLELPVDQALAAVKPMLEQLCQKNKPVSPVVLTQILWACVRSEAYDAPILGMLTTKVLESWDYLASQKDVLIKVLWCYGKLHHYDRELLTRAAEYAIDELSSERAAVKLRNAGSRGRSSLAAADVCAIATMLSTLGIPGQELTSQFAEAFIRGLTPNLHSFNQHTLAVATLSLACLRQRCWPFYAAVWKEAGSRDITPTNKELSQHMFAWLWVQTYSEHDPGAKEALGALPEFLREHGFMFLSTWSQHSNRVSDLQRRVFRVLKQMGMVPAMESLTSDGLFSLDMLVRVRRDGSPGHERDTNAAEHCLIAVEVNGPSHYTSSSPHRLLPSKTLRDELLAARGIRVLHVPWFMWQGMEGDVGRCEQWLQNQLLRLANADQVEGSMHKAQPTLKRQATSQRVKKSAEWAT